MKIIAQVTLQTATGYTLPGEELDLEAAEAQRLVARGLAKLVAITEHLAATEPEVSSEVVTKERRLIARLVKAIALLKPNQFSRTGKPLLLALRAKLKKKVTTAQRDTAWQQYQKEKEHD